jgi:alkylation response protein AidB-like acyl-CoA dehydrogenase
MCCSAARTQRMIVEECLKWAPLCRLTIVHPVKTRSYRWTNQRKAFGKPLNSQAVIRNKLASMIARVESVQNYLENITHQMNNMVRLPVNNHLSDES